MIHKCAFVQDNYIININLYLFDITEEFIAFSLENTSGNSHSHQEEVVLEFTEFCYYSRYLFRHSVQLDHVVSHAEIQRIRILETFQLFHHTANSWDRIRFPKKNIVDFTEVGQESYSSFLIHYYEYWCVVFRMLHQS